MKAQERVDQIVAGILTEKQELADSLSAERERSNQLLAALAPKLEDFRIDLLGRVPVRVRKGDTSKISIRPENYLAVTLGRNEFYAMPLAKVHITANGHKDRNSYWLNWQTPKKKLKGFENANCSTPDDVIEKLSEAAAQFLLEPPEEELAEWVRWTGIVLGVISFVIVWVLFCFGGVWGFLLGWIPAYVAGLIVRYGWYWIIPCCLALLVAKL